MYYKLTNQKMQTHNGFQLEIGKWYKIEDVTDCRVSCHYEDYWFRCYESTILAAIFNAIQGNIHRPRLFSVKVDGDKEEDAVINIGFTRIWLQAELELPNVNINQRVAFGILCAKKIYDNPEWVVWADNWLSNEDRSLDTAWTSYEMAHTYCGPGRAAHWAAYAAARMEQGKDWANGLAADSAAIAAASAAQNADCVLDLVALAQEAMKY